MNGTDQRRKWALTVLASAIVFNIAFLYTLFGLAVITGLSAVVGSAYVVLNRILSTAKDDHPVDEWLRHVFRSTQRKELAALVLWGSFVGLNLYSYQTKPEAMFGLTGDIQDAHGRPVRNFVVQLETRSGRSRSVTDDKGEFVFTGDLADVEEGARLLWFWQGQEGSQALTYDEIKAGKIRPVRPR